MGINTADIGAGMQSLFARYRQERREGPSMEWLKDVVKKERYDRDLVAACESILCNDVKPWYLVALNEAEGGCHYTVTRSSVAEIIRQNPRVPSRLEVPRSSRVTFSEGQKPVVVADVGMYSGVLFAHICDFQNTDPKAITYEIAQPCLMRLPRDDESWSSWTLEQWVAASWACVSFASGKGLHRRRQPIILDVRGT